MCTTSTVELGKVWLYNLMRLVIVGTLKPHQAVCNGMTPGQAPIGIKEYINVLWNLFQPEVACRPPDNFNYKDLVPETPPLCFQWYAHSLLKGSCNG